MIELIFVIVIIGILATIAVLMLNSTRDDAKASVIIANTKLIIKDAKSYYTSQGVDNWQSATVLDVTDVPLFMDTSCTQQAGVSDAFDGNKFYLCDDDMQDVIVLDVNNTYISVESGSSTSAIADAVKNDKAFKALMKSHRLGGISISK